MIKYVDNPIEEMEMILNVATTESFGINKPAGVYTDTYRIQVYF